MAEPRESARPLSELDKATQERLGRLMGADAQSLSKGDKAFLEARKDYLTAAQRKDFGIKGGSTQGGGTGGNDPNEERDKYDGMNQAALKAELKKRKLAVSGKVEELRERLREHDAAQVAE